MICVRPRQQIFTPLVDDFVLWLDCSFEGAAWSKFILNYCIAYFGLIAIGIFTFDQYVNLIFLADETYSNNELVIMLFFKYSIGTSPPFINQNQESIDCVLIILRFPTFVEFKSLFDTIFW
jgi:hypothetical protein